MKNEIKKNKFRKKCIILCLLFWYSLAFANTQDGKIKKEKFQTIAFCEKAMKSNNQIDMFVGDFYNADAVLYSLEDNNKIIFKELVLFLPDTELIEKYYDGMVNSSENIFICVLGKKTEEKHYKKRSLEELVKINKFSEIMKNPKIKLIILENDKIKLKKLFEKSLDNAVIECSEFKEEFYEKYKKLTKKNYLKNYYEVKE